MASLTPGVLYHLFNTAAGNSVSTSPLLSSHRSPLLQVIEIVPCLSDDQWRSEGFFVKVSDSLHSAYVAVSAGDDADLIRSDKIQLGQFVYICGGLHFEKGCHVPVVRGLKPVLKRNLCVGNPIDLFSSDLLLPFTQVSVSSTTTTKKKNDIEPRRLSLDSSRRRSCWDQTPPVTPRRDSDLVLSYPHLKHKLVLTGKNESFTSETPALRNRNVVKPSSPISKYLNCETPSLRNRYVVKPPSPRSMSNSPKDGVKSLPKAVAPPVRLYKLPSSRRTWSDQRILWSELPKTIQSLGKEVSSHRQVAVSTAVSALEETSAMESVLISLQAFTELCDSSKKLSAVQVVRRFLDFYHSTLNAGRAVHLLLTRSQNNGLCRLAANKNAASWVQDAVVTGFSQFNLFKDPEGAADHYYIVIEDSSHKLDHKDTTVPRNTAYKDVKLPSTKRCSLSARSCLGSKSRLKESAILVDELVRVSSQWFLKYLENSLKKGSLVTKVEATRKESHLVQLVQLKLLIRWLDDVILHRTETREKVEDLRKKLLEHIDSTMGETR